MARDIEDTLTTRLTLLFNERYGLPEAVTQSFAGGNFLDVFVPIEYIKVVVEAKKGQTTLRKRQAARTRTNACALGTRTSRSRSAIPKRRRLPRSPRTR